MDGRPNAPTQGGVIHTYQKYDPRHFPMPDAAPPDLVTPAFEHLLTFGSLRELTEEELAEAVELDPREIAGLGPSVAALLAVLEERKRRLLATYETETARRAAAQAYRRQARQISPPAKLQKRFDRAVAGEQIPDLERLWYGLDERGALARGLLRLIERLGEKYQVEELAAKYTFTGQAPMDVPKALAVKEELETIDRLIRQLKEAAKHAKLYVIDMEALARFADDEAMQQLEGLRRQVEDLLREMAAQQGLNQRGRRYTLTPRAYRIFQTKVLDRIFSQLQAAKSGRHALPLTGDGAVEMQRTKPYEFGDSLANMDVAASLVNAMVREGQGGRRMSEGGLQEKDGVARNPPSALRTPSSAPRVRLRPDDIEIHLTRNNPKCATVVCMDMSGSMRWGMQYVNVKRVALALHGLIRTEYPGDFIGFVEIFSFSKRRHISEVPELMPKPVSVGEPWVRVKVDMSRPDVSELALPQHFTNIQQGLCLARQILQEQDTPNRQIILITDGLPTAHFEGSWLYFLYPPDARTESRTLREGLLCRAQGMTINIFLLQGWSQRREDIRFAHHLAESAGGRVFFVAGKELDRFVVWDYVSRRRSVIG